MTMRGYHLPILMVKAGASVHKDSLKDTDQQVENLICKSDAKSGDVGFILFTIGQVHKTRWKVDDKLLV